MYLYLYTYTNHINIKIELTNKNIWLTFSKDLDKVFIVFYSKKI